MLLKVIAENNDNIYADVLVHFSDKDDEWVLRGRWHGYDKEAKGYLELPVKGYLQKLYHEDEVGEQFTEKFDKLSRKEMRLIWDYLQKQDFELEDINN